MTGDVDRELNADSSLNAALIPSFQYIVENASDGVWVIDTNSVTEYVNQRMCEMLGYSKSELMGRNFDEFIPEEERQDHLKRIASRTKVQTDHYERRLIRKDGGTVWVSISARALFEDKGKLLGSFAICTDISETKEQDRVNAIVSHTLSELAQVEEIDTVCQIITKRIHTILGNSMVGSSRVDEANEYIYINQLVGANEQFYQLVNQLKFNPLEEHYPIKDAPLYEMDILTAGKLLQFEGGLHLLMMKKLPKKVCKLVEKQLNINHIYVMGMVSEGRHFGAVYLFTPNEIDKQKEAIESIILQATQVSKRILSETKTRISEERLKQTFDAIDDGYWDWDITTGKVVVNDNWYTMLGYTPGEFLSDYDHFVKMVHPDDLVNIRQKLSSLMEDGANYFIELRLKTKSGGYKWVLSRGNVIARDENGKVMRAVGTHTDISERKQFEILRDQFLQAQRKILQVENLQELYQLVGNALIQVMQEGYVVITQIEDQSKIVRLAGLFGFGMLIEEIMKTLKLKPASFETSLTDISPNHLKIWRSNTLTEFDEGLYGVLNGKLPKSVCEIIEKRLEFQKIFIMGCQWSGIDFGGVVFFAKRDLSPVKSMLETLVNDSAIAIQRIHTEEMVKSANEKYRSIFEKSPVGVVTLDADYRYLSINDEYSRICGYSKEELQNLSFKEISHPEDIDLQIQMMDRLMKDELDVCSLIKRYQHKDGRVVWAKLIVNKICDSNGKFEYLLAMVTDITREVAVEEALNDNRRFLKMVLDTIPTMVFVRDMDGKYRLANQAFAQAMGLPAESIIGKTDQDLYARRKNADEIHQQDLEVLQSKKDWVNNDLDITFPDASTRAVQFIKRALPDVGHMNPAVLGVITDISERKKFEQILAENERKYRILFESMRQGIFYQKPDGAVFDINPAALEIFGLSQAEFIERFNSKTDWNMMDENGTFIALENRPTPEVFRTGKPVLEKTVCFYNNLTNRLVWVVMNAIPQFREGESRPYQAFVTINDVTALKEIERELRVSEMRYRSLIQNSPSGVYQADQQGCYQYINDRLWQINQASKDELLGEGWLDGIHVEDRGRVAALWKEFITTGGKWSVQYRLVDQVTKQSVWVLDEAEPLYDVDEKIIGFIGSKVDLSEQKSHEELIKKSEEKYRLLTENMKDVVWILDTETMHFTYISPSIYDLRGYTPEEVIANPLSAALTKAGAESFEKTILQHVQSYQNGKISSSDYFTYETPQVHQNGSLVWTEVIASMHQNPENGHLELHGVTRNITDRKIGELALQQSEEKHRLLVENSHDIIYTLSTTHLYTFVSSAWTALLGIPVEETLGQPFTTFVHPDDIKKCTSFFESINKKGERQSGLEYRIKHADGSWRWYSTSGLPVFDAAGKCVGLEGTCHDITERKMAEDALLESEERYRLLVEKSPVGIMLMLKGKFVYANPTAVNLFGFDTMEELVGKSAMDFIHPESKQALLKRILDIRHSKPNPLMEIKIIRKDGQICETESTSSQIRLMGENATLVFAQDISARKIAENQIRKNADDLILIKALNDSVNRGDPLSVTLQSLIDYAKRLFTSNGAAVYLVSSDDKYLELQNFHLHEKVIRWIEKTIGVKIPSTRIKLTKESLYAEILTGKQFRLLEGQEQIVRLMKEFTDSPIYKKLIPTIYEQLRINSVVAIPLIAHGESVGLLELSSRVPFTEEDRARLEFISSELGSIIRRKQAEEALRESEEKFRQIVERSNDIFLRQNYDTLQVEYVSPNAFQQLGYTQEEATSMSHEEIMALLHPEDLQTFDHFRRTIVDLHQKGHNTTIKQYRLRKKSGDYLWINANYSLVQDDSGRPKQVIGTLSDITPIKINESILNFRVKFMQLSNSLSLDELLLAILDEIEKNSESRLGFCHFLTEDERTITRSIWSTNLKKATDFDFSAALEHESAKNIWRTVVKQKKALLMNDLQSIPESLVSTDGRSKVTRAMVLPVIRSEKVVALIALANKGYAYSNEDLDYVSTLADLAWDVIENKLIQSALQESEAVFNAFMENSPIYVFFKDKEIRSRRLSRNFEQMLGKPLEELIDKSMNDLFPSEFAQSMVEDDKRILNEGQTISVDEELNGRYYTTIKFPIFKDGRPEFLAGFTIDTTERVLSEKKLAESEELYRLISSVVSDYLFSTRLNDEGMLELQWVAGAFEAITGYTMAEYIQVGGWRALVYPDDLAVDDQDMQTLKQNKKVITEIRTLQKDGSIKWVRIYAQPIWDEISNRLVGINGAVQDITERKKVEEAIKKSAREFEVLYDTAKDFSMHRDPFVILRTIADRACALFGATNSFVYLYDPETKDLELRFSKNLSHPMGLRVKLGEGLSGLVAQTLEPKIVDDYSEWQNKLSALDSSELAATLCVPMMYGGQLIGVLGVQEIHPSQHKFTEDDAHFLSLFASQAAGAIYGSDLFEQLKINAAELEKRVDERTRELQTKNKELETFTYTVSHDLKAPLRGISGYSTLLMEDYSDCLDEEGKRYLQNLVSSTDRMNVLIEDLLSYSRIERRELKNTTVDLKELLEKIILEYQSEVISRKLQFKMDLECGTLFTDVEAISQALRNIIDNAVKFTKDRPDPTISIRCDHLEDHVLISVEDNGIGFDMKYYNKIFEIFQRLHLTEEYPGTGVGLAVVRKAIERLGGKIWAVSQPGEGSTFFMELPL